MAFPVRRLRNLIVISSGLIIWLYYLGAGSDSWIHRPGFLPEGDLKPEDEIVHWSALGDHYPVTSFIPLPTGKPVSIPAIQAVAKPEDEATKTERLKRQAAVKASFVHSWEGYKTHAWLRDEVQPVAGGSRDTFGGWAASLVDALDTLWIMGLEKDFELAVEAAQQIDFTIMRSDRVNVFETTIRYLGGFLAAYDVSEAKYPVLLTKAMEVGDLLMSCFDTPNRMPIDRWAWRFYVENNKQEAPRQMIVAELGSLSVEFTRLSQLSGERKYYDAIQRISDVLEQYQNATKLPGMWPLFVDAATPAFDVNNQFHFGGMSDSLYEYLPKQYMMLGGLLKQSQKMYEKVIDTAKDHLFYRVLNKKNEKLLLSGEIRVAPDGRIDLDSKGQHLGCFVGGMVGIGSRIFERPDELEIAKQLANGCVWAYESQVTGIAPEKFSVIGCQPDDCVWSDERWHKGVMDKHGTETKPGETTEEKVLRMIESRRLAPGFTEIADPKYILRPEAIESVFIMYRITGDVEWQNKAWRMFERIEHVTKTQIASSAIDDVTSGKPNKTNSMESFWLAETLKYFYLIFSELDLVSLDEFVLNTEAHPLRRPAV